jgi:hypothetical protein
MSRYTLSAKAPHQRLVVGVDSALPEPSFFGQVSAEDAEQQQADAPLVWVGGGVPPLRDLEPVVAALAPYGEIPLALQLQLVEELDQRAPFSLTALGQQLALICQQAPDTRVAALPEPEQRVCLLLDQRGWQTWPWRLVIRQPDEWFAHLLFAGQSIPFEYVSAYVSDRSIVFRVHGQGMKLRLPVYAIFARGAALCGPVAIANDTSGLSAEQVQIIQQEVLRVPDVLRPHVICDFAMQQVPLCSAARWPL